MNNMVISDSDIVVNIDINDIVDNKVDIEEHNLNNQVNMLINLICSMCIINYIPKWVNTIKIHRL